MGKSLLTRNGFTPPFLKRWKSLGRAGFTLVEVVVSALLITTVMAGLFSVFVSGYRWTGQRDASGSNLAKEKVEILKEAVRQDWWTEPNRPLTPGYEEEKSFLIPFTNKRFIRHYKASSVDWDRDGIEDFRKAEVTVRWAAD